MLNCAPTATAACAPNRSLDDACASTNTVQLRACVCLCFGVTIAVDVGIGTVIMLLDVVVGVAVLVALVTFFKNGEPHTTTART